MSTSRSPYPGRIRRSIAALTGVVLLGLTVAAPAVADEDVAFDEEVVVDELAGNDAGPSDTPPTPDLVSDVDHHGLEPDALPESGTGQFSPQSSKSDPLGLVTYAEWMRGVSLGVDRVAVWVCNVPSDTTSSFYQHYGHAYEFDPVAVAAWADVAVTPWFDAASGGAYTLEFTGAGTIVLEPHEGYWDCFSRARAATGSPYSNVMAIDTSRYSGGLGGPGNWGTLDDAPADTGRGFYVGGGVVSYVGEAPGELAIPQVIIHEIGHTLHWPHSHLSNSDHYDNPADVMSGLWLPNNVYCPVDSPHYSWWYCRTMNTLAFNRYAAGWIDPADVSVYAGGSETRTLVGANRAGQQMAVIEKNGVLATFEARINEGHDTALDEHGVAVHVIDQTSAACSYSVCPSLWRKQSQAVGPSKSWNHVLQPGDSLTVLGTVVEVTGTVAGGYTIRLSVPQVAPTAPTAPRSVSATPGDRRATVSWQAPSSNGGSSITSYRATASPGGRSCSTTGGGRSCTITGLTNGTTYKVTVRATNSAGTSPKSSWASVRPSGAGYWMAAANGTVYGFGSATSDGSKPGATVAITAGPNGSYWLLHADGRVTARSGAKHWGDARYAQWGFEWGEFVTTMSAMPNGSGYWIFTNRGRVLTYGSAPHLGSMVGTALSGPIVDSVATPDGKGYYMVGTDGGVFAFGNAQFRGSTGGMRLNQPIVALIPTPAGTGYWLVAADGGIFAFNAPFRGSVPGALAPGSSLNQPVIGGVPYGNGYVLISSDGGAFSFSDQAFLGSLGGSSLPSPIVGLAVRRT